MSAPMPRGPAPLDREAIDIVKRKIISPKGPPPALDKSFRSPKVPDGMAAASKPFSTRRYADDDDDDMSSLHSEGESDIQSHRFDYYESDPDRIVVRQKLNTERSKKYLEEEDHDHESKPMTQEYKEDSKTEHGETIFNYRPLLKATYRVLREFVLTPSERNVLTRCYIERTLKASEFFVPRYSLCADLEDGTGRELIVCRKIMSSRSAHYGMLTKNALNLIFIGILV